jgi:hypothetical protein
MPILDGGPDERRGDRLHDRHRHRAGALGVTELVGLQSDPAVLEQQAAHAVQRQVVVEVVALALRRERDTVEARVGGGQRVHALTVSDRASREQAVDIAERVDLDIRQRLSVVHLSHGADLLARMGVGDLGARGRASQQADDARDPEQRERGMVVERDGHRLLRRS